jgi:hypothetical protein
MYAFKIIYKGKEYTSSEEASKHQVVNVLLNVLRLRLASFEREIVNEGGIIEVDCDTQKIPIIVCKHLSLDLNARIDALEN